MQCPYCSSTDSIWKAKAAKWECNACEERFEGPSPESDTSKQTSSPKAAKPKRIFFSYGHDTNRELVDRFKTDLEARGHQIWIDYKEIGSWDDWKGTITRGIHDAEMAIAFLSIHSTRDPGVCRNEVAMALQHFGKVYPVLVEQVPLESIPVTIAHLQWPDLSRWREFRDQEDLDFERFYEEKFLEIVSRVEGEAGRFASEAEVLRRVLNPSGFEGRFARHLAGFTGREWVFEAYEHWLYHQPSSRVFWIKAGPGFGKTALAVQMANRHRAAIVGTWFCDHQSVELRDPIRALQTIAYQLALRWDDYRVRLLKRLEIFGDSASDQIEAAKERLLAKTNPSQKKDEELDQHAIIRDVFSHLLSEPMAGAIWREHKLVILLDGLDEATAPDGSNPMAELISQHFLELPEWIGFVVTSRPDASVVGYLQAFKPFAIEAGDARNTQDLRVFCESQVAPLLSGMDSGERERICCLLVEKSDGMMLYLNRIAQGLKEGTLAIGSLESLEGGVPGLYSRYHAEFTARFRKNFQESIQPLLRLALATPGPLPLELASEVLGWNRESIVRSLTLVGSYLVEDQGGFSLFHKTLAEWLGREDAGIFYTDAAPMRNAILGKLVEKFVERIHTDPLALNENGSVYKYNEAFDDFDSPHRTPPPPSKVITGWANRLDVSLYRTNRTLPQSLLEQIQQIINKVRLGFSWTPEEEAIAVELATEVFSTRGLPIRLHKNKLTVDNVRGVLEMVIHGNSVLPSPMNTGWSALAAVATEDQSEQLIALDSRASLSICYRLAQVSEKLNIQPKLLQGIFKNQMGWLPGRGGNRSTLTTKVSEWFPCRYGKWGAVFAASEFVRSVRDHLNANPSKYPKSTSQTATPWAVREVEQVLFMDGY